MPFTPTHVLAIVPISKTFKSLSFSALFIAAMVPDLPMFIPIGSYDFSHSLIGLFLYCLPIGLVSFILFEKYEKRFLIDLSPSWVRQRLFEQRHSRLSLSLQNYFWIFISVLIGSFTHLFWDAFSHKSGFFVRMFPLFSNYIGFFGFRLPIYKAIQYGSTLIGLPVLLVLGLLYLKNGNAELVEKVDGVPRNITLLIIASYLLSIILVAIYQFQTGDSNISNLGNTIKSSIGVGVLLLLLYSLIYEFRK